MIPDFSHFLFCRCRYPIFALLCLIFCGAITAQPRFKTMSVEDGLSHSIIYSILQDQYGFMWFATGHGVNRYDGYNMSVFQHYPGDSTTLSSNIVRTILQDKAGNLWFGTDRGLNRLVAKPGSDGNAGSEYFERYTFSDSSGRSHGYNNIRSSYLDQENVIWIGANGGIVQCLPVNDRNEFELVPPRLPNGNPLDFKGEMVIGMLADDSANLWVSSLGGGLYKIDLEKNQVKNYRHNPSDPTSISSNYLTKIFAGPNNEIWLGSYRGGMIRFDPAREEAISYKPDPQDPASISDSRVYAFLEHSPGVYWVGTFGGGLSIFDLASESFTTVRKTPKTPNNLGHNFIRDIYRDRSDIVWIATNGGISKTDLKPIKFKHINHDPFDENSLKNNMVLSIYVDEKEDTWVGHNAGLDRFDRNGQYQRNYTIPHNNPKSGSGFVSDIVQANPQSLWIATLGGGVILLDKVKGIQKQFLQEAGNSNSISNNQATALHLDRSGQLWIGTRLGFCRYDPKTDRFRRYIKEATAVRSHSADIQSIELDNNGKIWLTTWQGLFYYDEARDSVLAFETSDKALQEALDVKINSIYQHQDGNYWIATENGLIEMNASGRMLRHLTELDGLPSSYICDIEGDEFGNIWVSTFFGFLRMNPAPGMLNTLRIFTIDDGIQSNEFNVGTAFHNPRTGELFFGGINGFNRFFPEKVKDNPLPPPVALTAFRKFDKTVLSGRALSETRAIELKHNEPYFAFEFSALDYTIPEKNQYAYKMVGFDERWIRSGNRRFASYTNLDAGEYRFQVRAANNDGIWNTEGVGINIIIHPPFWETWWFRLILAGIIIGALWLAYRARIRKLLELERMRVRIASDLHDDIGSSLTKIALYTDLMQNGTDAGESEKLLTKIGNMSRELIVTMSDIVWSIDARNDTYGDLLDRMHDFAIGLLPPQEISYTIKTRGISESQKLPANIRQNLYLIFKEAVNNVVRHSEASQVQISLEQQGQQFRLNIRDNGCGNSGTLRKSGHGLRNMQMRAERLGGELAVKQNGGLELDLTIEKI